MTPDDLDPITKRFPRPRPLAPYIAYMLSSVFGYAGAPWWSVAPFVLTVFGSEYTRLLAERRASSFWSPVLFTVFLSCAAANYLAFGLGWTIAKFI